MHRRVYAVALSLLAILAPAAATGAGPTAATGTLALATGNSSPGPGIWSLDLATRHLTRLTNGRADCATAWSRDGGRVAFVRRLHLFVVGSDGSGLHSVGKLPATDASWGPDDRLAVIDGSSISLVDADGTGQKRLLARGGIHGVAWSPDGETILFSWAVRGIYAVSAAGGAPRLLVPAPKPKGIHLYTLEAPSWSPNGERFAFAVVELGALTGRGPKIRTARADGTGVRAVARMAQLGVEPRIAWSPDGSLVAFPDYRSPQEGVYTVPSGGGGTPHLLYGGSSGTFWGCVAWSP